MGVRDIDEVEREIDALALYVKHRVQMPGVPGIVYAIARDWDGKMVFLQDGDALVYPFPKLVRALEYLGKKLPNVERVATYGTPQDILRRSVDELRRLKELKLGIIYMGVESGDDEVLKRVGKGADHAQMVAAAKKVKEAEIILSVTVILGLAGTEGSERHALETARILTEIDPEFAGALVLTPVPGTPVYDELERGDLHLISPFRSLEELKLIVQNASFTDCFFSSMHASNYVSVRGRLPGEKDRMLAQLDAILRTRDPRLLRPEYLRGL